MDFNKLIFDNLKDKIQAELEALRIEVLCDLISHVYIKKEKTEKSAFRHIVTLDCTGLPKESLSNILNVLSKYKTGYIDVDIVPFFTKLDKEKFSSNRLVFYIEIDRSKYKRLLVGNPFERNRD